MWSLFMMLALPQRVYAEPRVVCVDPQDAELRARIRGQTRDLALEFVFVAETANADLALFAERNAASFVVEVRALTGGVREVSIYDAVTRELRTRRAEPPGRAERFSHSAVAETIALIVRGELTAALSARESAENQAPPATTNAPPLTTPAPARTPTVPAADSGGATRAPKGPADVSPRLFTLAAGIRASLPGAGRVFVSPELSARLRVTPVVIGLTVNTALRSRANVGGFNIDLYKHSLSVEALGVFALSAAPALELALGLNAAAIMYRRAQAATGDARWEPTDGKTSLSASLGALSELRWSFTHSFGLSVRVGLDVNLRPLWLQTAGSPEMTNELSYLQRLEPWAALHLFADL
ncbi:MAG: hypothetical protein RL701_1874 [Pseudomonadota bacterium]